MMMGCVCVCQDAVIGGHTSVCPLPRHACVDSGVFAPAEPLLDGFVIIPAATS